MFQTPNEAVVAGLTMSEKLFHRYVGDLKPAEWHAQPLPGVNTVAWLVGHLAVVEHRRATALGATDLPDLPAGFADRYTATRRSAVEQPGLDAPEVLTALFVQVRAGLVAAVRSAGPEKLAEPLPTPHPLFADLGESALFMGLHAALHLGQITVLRRLFGHPPVT